MNKSVDIVHLKQKRAHHYMLLKSKKNAFEKNKNKYNYTEWKKAIKQFSLYESITPLTTHLVNLQNTCYISSVVQALAAVLYNYKNLLKTDDGLLPKLLLEMPKHNSNTAKLSSSGGIYERFVKHIRYRYAGNEMFDADELLLLLIDNLPNTSKLFDIQCTITNSSDVGETISEKDSQLRQYQMLSNADGTFDNLDIYLKKHKVRVDHLEKITDESSPPHTYYNAKQSTKYNVIHNKILIIHIQRFSFNSQSMQIIKNHEKFDYPFHFSSSWISEKCSHSYTLKAFIEHEGSHPDTGHYVAFAKYGTQWWKFDDLKLTPVAVENVGSQIPYILIYAADS